MKTLPVAGVDVSKYFSDMCILTPENEVFERLKIYHDMTSMERAKVSLQKVTERFGSAPVIVMESTSHYHLILYQFFMDAGYEVIVVNPLQSNALKNINVRKIKTDKVDAYRLALLYRMSVLRKSQVPIDALRSLRMLCRQHYELKGDITRYKNRLTAILDQTFPGFCKVFSDVAATSSLAVLELYQTPADVLAADTEHIVYIVSKAGHKNNKYGIKKMTKIIEVAEHAERIGIHAPGDQILIRSLVTILKQLLESVAVIDRQIRALVKQNEYIRTNVELLQTIPGVATFSATVILAEIGDFSLFAKPKQLAAYFGLDPAEKQSGTMQSTRNKLSKRGSPYARATLYMVAHNSVHLNRWGRIGNPILSDFYQKKCQTKSANVALCAVMHKVSNIIFAVLRDQRPFELRLPEAHAKLLCTKLAA